MPLGGKLWVDRCEITDAGDGAFSRAIWTTNTTASTRYGRLPFMTFATHPPNFFRRSGGYLCRREIAVLRGMPLGGEFGVDRREIVKTLKYFPSRTEWTAVTTFSVRDSSLPFMTTFTYPPHLLGAMGRYLIGM